MNKKVYLLVIIYQLLVACNNKAEDKNINVIYLVENASGIIVNSISFDLNNDSKLDRVSVIEQIDSTRLLLVEINKDNKFQIISSNNEIIGCKTCGYQNGDPFVHLDKTSNGFILYMEYGQITFFYESDSIYLGKINLSIIKQKIDSIEERHEIFLHQKFGKINLSDLKEGYILTIKNEYQKDVLFNVFSKSNPSNPVITKTNNCRDVQVEMGSGKICTFDNTTINDVYINFINSGEFPYTTYLELTIPSDDKVTNIGNNGLISIDYNWESKIKLVITLLFDGGTTEIHLEQKNNNVERSIYNFAN